MKSLLIALGLTALAGALAYSIDAPAYAKKEKMSFADKVAKLTEKYIDDKGGALFYDLTYWVDLAKTGEGRWTIPPKSTYNLSGPKGGNELQATLKAKESGPDAISVTIFKSMHRDQVAKTKFSRTFDETGRTVQMSDWKGFHEGMWENAKETAKEITDEKKPTKAKGAGPAAMFASITATWKPEDGRQRRDWYAWSTPNYTWWAKVTYHSSVLKKDDWIDKATDLLKNCKKIKDKLK